MVLKLPSLSEATRHYIYKLLFSAQPLVATYGIMTESTSVLWLSFASAVLATGMATKNTTSAKKSEVEE